jgi:hypothetical protein
MIEDVWVCTYAGKLLSGPFSDLETMILTAARRSAFPQRWGVFCYGWGVDSCRRRRRRSVFDGQWSMVNGQWSTDFWGGESEASVRAIGFGRCEEPCAKG